MTLTRVITGYPSVFDSNVNLILNIYKESGLSSFDVIRKLRRSFNTRKFGYIGTLDPFATGVLPVFSGEFTKLIPFIQSNDKSYSIVIVLVFHFFIFLNY